MLVNKSHLQGVGVEPVLASRYIKMLNRSCPSTTIKPTNKSKYVQGAQPTKNFDLDYALKITREYEFSTNEKCNTDEWRDLREVLDKIKLKGSKCK